MIAQGWKSFRCPSSILDIGVVLCSGQSFRWKEEDGCWTGIHKRRVWRMKQDDQNIWYKVLNDLKISQEVATSKTSTKRKVSTQQNYEPAKKCKIDGNSNAACLHMQDFDSEEDILHDYFHLKIDLTELCHKWSKADPHFASIEKKFKGMRMLRQDPVENVFSFICSSNNNITRISSMVEKMCQNFGEKILSYEGADYYAFPTIDALAENRTEETLRKLGFGYRAKFIHQSAVRILENGGAAWLHTLRHQPYDIAHSELVKLPGIGAKVADCICMMSLDKFEAIPVDTHVWQIATRDYKIKNLKPTKSLSASAYKSIGDYFRNLWGSHASWAMNFLFVADLKQFQKKKRET